MYEVIPGILEKDWESIERKLEIVRPFAKSIHLDLLDGIFAPNTTFLDPGPFKKYSNDFFFELHMMVDDPIKYLEAWSQAGIKRFVAHIEKMPNQEEFVKKAKEYGVQVGLAIDGPTSIFKLKVPINKLDMVLVMTITAGFSGQAFNPEHLGKVRFIRSKSEKVGIEVDGGVNDVTAVLAKEAGVNIFAATSFIYKSENPKEQFRILEKIVNSV